MCFITIYMIDQSDEFNVIGNKLVIVGALVRPSGIMSSSAIYGMLHSGWAITTKVTVLPNMHQ